MRHLAPHIIHFDIHLSGAGTHTETCTLLREAESNKLSQSAFLLRLQEAGAIIEEARDYVSIDQQQTLP